MIYLKSKNGQHFLILEPENLEQITQGKPASSPDQEVMVAYTPDLPWLAEQMKNMLTGEQHNNLDPARLAELLQYGLQRPAIKQRPYHELVILDGKAQ